MLDKEILEKGEKNKHIDYLHAYHITMQNHNTPTIINSLGEIFDITECLLNVL